MGVLGKFLRFWLEIAKVQTEWYSEMTMEHSPLPFLPTLEPKWLEHTMLYYVVLWYIAYCIMYVYCFFSLFNFVQVLFVHIAYYIILYHIILCRLSCASGPRRGSAP